MEVTGRRWTQHELDSNINVGMDIEIEPSELLEASKRPRGTPHR